jgi:ABC-type branched-subunit amino acid transport system ATPase component
MLTVKNIETWYDLIRALHGISFEVKQNDIVALLGSNGAGKTTTLKTIMRLLYDLRKEQPEKGTIEFLGVRIDRKSTDQIVKMFGWVPIQEKLRRVSKMISKTLWPTSPSSEKERIMKPVI